MVTVTDNQAQTDVPAVIAELNRKFEGQFVVQKTFDAFPTIWVSREQVIEVLLYLRTLPQPYVMYWIFQRLMSAYANIVKTGMAMPYLTVISPCSIT